MALPSYDEKKIYTTAFDKQVCTSNLENLSRVKRLVLLSIYSL